MKCLARHTSCPSGIGSCIEPDRDHSHRLTGVKRTYHYVTPWLSERTSELAEASGDEVLRALVAWAREQLLGIAKLDEVASQEEARVLGDTSRLLQVVRDDGDGVVLLELLDQLLNLEGGDGV